MESEARGDSFDTMKTLAMFLKIIIIIIEIDISYSGSIDEVNVPHMHIQVLCTVANPISNVACQTLSLKGGWRGGQNRRQSVKQVASVRREK